MSEPIETCLYAAIDAPRESHDQLLRELIAPLVRGIRGDPRLDSFFVVRYPEPVWQVRFRVLGRPAWIAGDVRPRVEGALAPFRATGAVGGVVFGEYVRETERYGGPEGMRLAEQVFQHDSVACLAVLAAEAQGQCAKSRREWSLVFTEDFLDLLGLDSFARVDFYREAHTWAFREGVFENSDRETLEARYQALKPGLAAIQSARREGDATAAYGGSAPAAIARECLEATRPVLAQVARGHAAGTITHDPARLAWSYMHLHCNRLGFDLSAEAILRYLLFRSYEDALETARSGPSI